MLGWDGVDKRIDVLAVALRAGLTIYDLEHLELAYAPPYGSAKDPVNMAGFLGANLLRGDIDLWYPEDYPDCADQVTILDTRTQAEYDAWHIPEAVLIPYTELRGRLDELPRDKPVYTYCRSGFRGDIAYCALKQTGFDDVAFLSGGMMTYHGHHRTPLAVGLGGMPVVEYAEDELAQRPGALEHRSARTERGDMTHVQVDVALHVRAEHAEGPLGRSERTAVVGGHHRRAGPLLRPDQQPKTLSWSTPGQPGGVALDALGEPVVATPGGLAVLDPRHSRTTELLVPIQAGPPENRANDLKVDGRGRAWVGTMAYDKRAGRAGLYRVDGGGTVDLCRRGSDHLERAGDRRGPRSPLPRRHGTVHRYVFDLDAESGRPHRASPVPRLHRRTGVAGRHDRRRRRPALGRPRSRAGAVHRYQAHGTLDARDRGSDPATPRRSPSAAPNGEDLYITTSWTDVEPDQRADQPLGRRDLPPPARA